MNYEMEELIPVVGKLAEKYTAHESSSVTYEKAEQLMEAVLYCIHELEEAGGNAVLSHEKMPAQRIYEMGLACVEEKTKKALELYNAILPGFYHFGNPCLYDSFVKELPAFFRRYDIRFAPQNTGLILDYPVLKDISACRGIDKIYEFIKCICLEQKFLHLFPVNDVMNILSNAKKHGDHSMENICETVYTHVIGHVLAGRAISDFEFEEADVTKIRKVFAQADLRDINKKLKDEVETLCRNDCEGEEELLEYLLGATGGIVARLKNAAEHDAPGGIL